MAILSITINCFDINQTTMKISYLCNWYFGYICKLIYKKEKKKSTHVGINQTKISFEINPTY